MTGFTPARVYDISVSIVHSFYKNAFTTIKNKSYFIKLVSKIIKEILLYNF